MHELSIALSLIELADETLREYPGERVMTVHLKIGHLSGVVPDALRAAFELAREGTRLSEAVLNIECVPVKLACDQCQGEQLAESVQCLRCSVCGSLSSRVIQGRELDLWALEITDSSTQSALLPESTP